MWKLALDKFVKNYKKNENVEAILLVGSYAVGNNDKYSDIDVYIIINDQEKYRERGNVLIDNYLIEYFINPQKKLIEYMRLDKRGHGGPLANMLKNCKILYDKNDIIPALKKEAIKYEKIKNKKDIMKYYVAWCAYDDYKAAKYFNHMQYYICLKHIIEAYMYNNNYNLLPEQKIERFFKDKKYREKYKLNKFPRNKFNKLVINCFNNENEENLKKLYEYVIKDGNFDINNFILRQEIE